jgi:predicted transposase YdaD
VGLSADIPKEDERYELHRMLDTIFSEKHSGKEKLKILEEEFEFIVDDELRKGVSKMGSLSDGIWERGLREGEMRGRRSGIAEGESRIILSMHKKGYSTTQIADISGVELDRVEAIVEESMATMV